MSPMRRKAGAGSAQRKRGAVKRSKRGAASEAICWGAATAASDALARAAKCSHVQQWAAMGQELCAATCAASVAKRVWRRGASVTNGSKRGERTERNDVMGERVWRRAATCTDGRQWRGMCGDHGESQRSHRVKQSQASAVELASAVEPAIAAKASECSEALGGQRSAVDVLMAAFNSGARAASTAMCARSRTDEASPMARRRGGEMANEKGMKLWARTFPPRGLPRT